MFQVVGLGNLDWIYMRTRLPRLHFPSIRSEFETDTYFKTYSIENLEYHWHKSWSLVKVSIIEILLGWQPIALTYIWIFNIQMLTTRNVWLWQNEINIQRSWLSGESNKEELVRRRDLYQNFTTRGLLWRKSITGVSRGLRVN